MKQTIAELKGQNPTLVHREAFKLAAAKVRFLKKYAGVVDSDPFQWRASGPRKPTVVSSNVDAPPSEPQ